MRLKSVIEGLNTINDGALSRPLFESIIAPEIAAAVEQWIGSADIPGVLIGGLALSFYAKPRYTADIDVIYATDSDIPGNIRGFNRIRSHSFQHNDTHAEVEVLSPEFLGLPKDLVKQVVNTAVTSNGMKIASPSGLVALKLFRGGRQDQADIEQLIQTGNVDLTHFKQWLSNDQMAMYQEIKDSI